ncbi:MAG: UPF0280 family protein [Rubritepida sp.]|nr:UPF0280 family protein [Rubritepida sp.]
MNAHSLPDGRLSIEDGPIRLVIGIEGAPGAVRAGQDAAGLRLHGLLAALCGELPLLRTPLGDTPPRPRHPVARRMVEACWPHRLEHITPMAAVAGAVAEHVLAGIVEHPVRVAHVNNGGDIALYLAPGASLRVGLCADLSGGRADALARLGPADGVGGIATSGWPGRSFSRGIADAVTVLAGRAADADAAATVIANAVDADHPAITRRPAGSIDPDSDLGDLPVTVAVGALPLMLVQLALARGARVAERLAGRGVIKAALLRLQGESLAVGDMNVMVLPLAPGNAALR